MREKWARLITFLTGLIVLLLVIEFALVQNPVESDDTTLTIKEVSAPEPEPMETAPVVLDREAIEAGRLVYKEQGCALCHSIAGKGNPRNPLDGVGLRRTAEEIRDRIIGADTLQGVIPEHALKFKQSYKKLHDDDLSNLVIYLQNAG